MMPSKTGRRPKRKTSSDIFVDASTRPPDEIDGPPARPGPDAAATRLALGTEIASLRRALALTGVALARRAGISPAMLSRIESGVAQPSLATLDAIAHALQVPLARLFAKQDQQRDCSHVRAGQGVRVLRQGSRMGHIYELIGHSLTSPIFVEPYLVTLDEKAAPNTSFQHTGLEFLHLLSGRMTYRVQDLVYELAPGDSLLFDANALHGPEVLRERPITYLSVVLNIRP